MAAALFPGNSILRSISNFNPAEDNYAGKQAEAGRAGGPPATHAGALGGAHRPLGAPRLLLPPVRAPTFRATSRGTPGPAAPRTSAATHCFPTRGPRPPGRGGGGAAAPARSRRLSACAANVPGKQIQAGCFPLLFSRGVSSPGFPRGAGGGRGAGGSAPPANPTQNKPGDVRSRPPRAQAAPSGGRSQDPERLEGSEVRAAVEAQSR